MAPAASLATAHGHNIFDAQLARCQRKVISCGADGFVCLTEVESTSQSSQLLFQPEPFMGCYQAFKVGFASRDGPDVFFTAFGDGRARRFDLREPGHRVAIDARGVGLTCLEVSPRSDWLLAVGGNDPFLRLYDLRALPSGREAAPPPMR
ncbi:unnamed protein product, partial [Prorocentrum cordatum]